nr:MAG TPA: CDI immunity protein [Caudoviricetes sp.]
MAVWLRSPDEGCVNRPRGRTLQFYGVKKWSGFMRKHKCVLTN